MSKKCSAVQQQLRADDKCPAGVAAACTNLTAAKLSYTLPISSLNRLLLMALGQSQSAHSLTHCFNRLLFIALFGLFSAPNTETIILGTSVCVCDLWVHFNSSPQSAA